MTDPDPQTTSPGPDDASAQLPEMELPTAIWGYEREAVHAYVERLRRRLAEQAAAHTPDGAVRQAIEQVGAETSAVLQRAHEIAEEVTAKSRAEADDRLRRADEEARALREAAEARVLEMDSELERLWQERQRLMADMDRIADELRDIVHAADERFPADEEPEDATSELELPETPADEGS